MTKTKEDYKNQLKGIENYIDWFHRFKQECLLEGWILQNGDYSSDAAKIKAAKKHLLKVVANSAIGYVDVGLTVPEIIQNLSNAFGQGYTDADDQIELVKNNIWFNPKKNPLRVFSWLNKQLRIITAANGDVTVAQQIEIVLKGLDSPKDIGQFWFSCKGQLKMDKRDNKVHTASLASIEKYIMTYLLGSKSLM